MKIYIRSFAMIREIIGSKRIDMYINDDVNIKDVIRQLVLNYPALQEYLIKNGEINNNILLVINSDEVNKTDYKKIILKENDEISIVPPSGGG